jgi:hypothetical protein
VNLALAILLIALGIADCITTIIALRHGARELNPLAAALFKAIGPVAGLLALKLAATAVIIFVLLPRPALWPLMALSAGVYGFVVWNNIRVSREG